MADEHESFLSDGVPVFPLPEHVLLPATPTPYRLFEPRYLALLRAVLALPPHARWIAVPRILPGFEDQHAARPPFAGIATVARLLETLENGDGTAHVVLGEGVRCRLDEIASPDPFRRAAARALPDVPAPAEPGADDGWDALVQVIAGLGQVRGAAARGVALLVQQDAPREAIVWRLGSVLIQSAERRYEFLVMREAAARQQAVLHAAAVLLGLAHERAGQLPC